MKKGILFVFIVVVILIVIVTITMQNGNTITNKEEPINNNTFQNDMPTNRNYQNNMENETKHNQNSIQENEKIAEGENMPSLKIEIGNQDFVATLYDNKATRELIKQMPLSINMSELHGNEKYYYFNQNLPTNSEKISTIKNGDLMLYGSNCFVLFYENFNTTYNYTKIGKIDNPSELKQAVGNGDIQVTFSINN